MLKIKNLSLSKKNTQLLREVECEFPCKATTLLLGTSGSGKTSLLRCLAQLEQEYEGEVVCDEKSLLAFSQKERCRLLGFVSQSYALFPHMSAWDNCTRPLRNMLRCSKQDAADKVNKIFEFLEISKYKESYPHELSGGQQQRVAIARALMLDPLFLLLDEPTSALDPKNAGKLVEILQKLQDAGRGLIIASHDMSFAAQMLGRALLLEEGRVVEASMDKTTMGARLRAFLGNSMSR